MNVAPRGLLGVALFAVGLAVGGLGVYAWDHRSAGPPRQLEATVFLPTQDRHGTPFPDGRWQEAVKLLVAAAGGATVGPPQEGWWQTDSSTVVHEPVRPVIVSFPRDVLPRFRQATLEVGRLLEQQAIYVRYEEPRVELILPGASSD